MSKISEIKTIFQDAGKKMMSTIKYETEVTKLGPSAQELIDSGIFVFFDTDAPAELAEFAILHEHEQLHRDVAAGDMLMIDHNAFRILAVGKMVNKNLADLGHLVVKFNGQVEPEMPGDISVENVPLPTIEPGTVVKIISGDLG